MTEANEEVRRTKTFVDFDHTLLAANSTELFIAFCRPSFVVAIIDFLLRTCVPWRIFPVAARYRMRDHFCCLTLIFLTPWNLFRWRRAAPAIFEKHRSVVVDEMLDKSQEIVVVSFGNQAIIEPMLQRSVWARSTVIATPLTSGIGRFARNKVALLKEYYDAQTVASAKFITDSEEDRDLLDAVAEGIKIPVQGEINRASERLYIPLRYTVGIKYSRGYALDQFFFVDAMLVALATITPATGFRDLPALLLMDIFLVLSIMCIYELGYYENDFVGSAREVVATLTAASKRYAFFPIHRNAWLWAAIAGSVALYLGYKKETLALDWNVAIILWCAVLVLIRVTFYVYNRLQPKFRIFLYLVLQIEKSILILLLLVPTLPGIMLVASHVIAMWIIYILYRAGGRRTEISREWVRFALFVLLMGCLGVALPSVLMSEWFSIALMSIWCLLRLVKAPLVRLLRTGRMSSADLSKIRKVSE
jgi:hypothetical protein